MDKDKKLKKIAKVESYKLYIYKVRGCPVCVAW